MVENFVDISACKPLDDDGQPVPDKAFLPEALNLYSKLPLLQFSGLERDNYRGLSGCAIFGRENNNLVGLILFYIDSSCFVLPLSVLPHCFAKYKRDQERERMARGGTQHGRRRGSLSGSGSGGTQHGRRGDGHSGRT
ncbi:hypothetical protein RND81_02G054300 [Saponaria officinalis]|uniref:Uncharacterized protein n=1 Tax=Saponaria officinalis TaxID=3572 RepID=A0AAW1MQ66_SAPOF